MTAWDPKKDIDALMDRFAKPCIHLHRPFPPRASRGRSKLGGLPNLPSQVEWPHGHEHFGRKRGRIPLHFMAQIDCSELPRIDAALPSSGMLFFFANIDSAADWTEHPADHYRRVVYVADVALHQPPRQPPDDLPELGHWQPAGWPRGYIGNPYPLGFRFGHQPDAPFTGKIYFEWPIEFVVSNSYPHTHAIRQTKAWQDLARFAELSTAEEKARGGNEWWDDGSLADYYQDYSSDRAVAEFYAALGEAPSSREYPQRKPKLWREIDSVMQGTFAPTAAFVAEVATSIDNMLLDRVLEARRQNAPPAPAHAGDDRMFDQLAGRIRGLFGLRESPPLQPAPVPTGPNWFDDVAIVRQETAQWLKYARALPADRAIDPDTREQFLAWLDAFEDHGFGRIAGHKPEVGDVNYMYTSALFQFARLSASLPSIRAHLPDQIYQLSRPFSGSHHQMLGHFPCSQEPETRGAHMVPLLSLSYDTVPDFRICDVGEMQFYIDERDLARRDFSRVEAQMQGG